MRGAPAPAPAVEGGPALQAERTLAEAIEGATQLEARLAPLSEVHVHDDIACVTAYAPMPTPTRRVAMLSFDRKRRIGLRCPRGWCESYPNSCEGPDFRYLD